MMKKILILLALFVSLTSFSQMGMGGMNDQMGGRGMGRGMGSGQQNMGVTPSDKPEKVDFIKATVERLEKDLSLDLLQSAVIKSILVEGQASIQTVVESKVSDDLKVDKIAQIQEKTELKILKILNKDQIEKYNKVKTKNKKK